jgi:hypothetical protein
VIAPCLHRSIVPRAAVQVLSSLKGLTSLTIGLTPTYDDYNSSSSSRKQCGDARVSPAAAGSTGRVSCHIAHASYEQLAAWLRGLHELHTLRLGNFTMQYERHQSVARGGVLAAVAELPGLRDLYIGWPLKGAIAIYLAAATQLTKLDLSQCGLTVAVRELLGQRLAGVMQLDVGRTGNCSGQGQDDEEAEQGRLEGGRWLKACFWSCLRGSLFPWA